MKQTIGTCSLCGGPVSVESPCWSIVPPVPQCEQCGATMAAQYGPVIPMRHSDYYVVTDKNTTWGQDYAWTVRG